MVNQQYIGITGFMSHQEVDAVLQSLPSNFGIANGKQIRKLMVGMLVSGKTVKGIPNKWPNRYPTPDIIPSVFVDDPRVLNLVHYNTKETDPGLIVEEMCQIEELSGPYFHGFQLNMVWPSVFMILNKWLTTNVPQGYSRKQKVIVLQCGGRAMAQFNHSPERLVEKLTEYEGVIDYVLIDPSGGIGMPFNTGFAMNCFEHLFETTCLPTMGFGIAGGLSPETLPGLLEPILERFPEISIDAEGRLRTQEDNLSIEVANEYVAIAEDLFCKYQP